MSTINPQKSPKFICNCCEYKTNNKKDYNKHLLTKKHTINSLSTDTISNNLKTHICVCGKKYKGRDGLWRHKKICDYTSTLVLSNKSNYDSDDDSEMDDDLDTIEETNESLMRTILKENAEFKRDILEILKNGTHQVNATYNNNNNNNTFNLHFFLNETCKNAMNITEFIESINVTISDLKNLAKKGYVEGISGLIVKNLKDLDITKRPLHCSDIKRETIYIKDKNSWEKDSDQKERLKHVILEISKINTRTLADKYKKMYPQCETDYDSKEHDEYWKIFHEALGGDEKNMDLQEGRVIKKIAKQIIIEK